MLTKKQPGTVPRLHPQFLFTMLCTKAREVLGPLGLTCMYPPTYPHKTTLSVPWCLLLSVLEWGRIGLETLDFVPPEHINWNLLTIKIVE